MTVFAYECVADADVFRFLKESCRLPLEGFHGFGQGPVVEAVLVKERAEIGMVDEDPLSSHHRERDRMELVGNWSPRPCRSGNATSDTS